MPRASLSAFLALILSLLAVSMQCPPLPIGSKDDDDGGLTTALDRDETINSRQRAYAPPVAAFPDDNAGGKYGFINRFGDVVLQPQYQWARNYINGLALVQAESKLYLIDAQGRREASFPGGTEQVIQSPEGPVWFRQEDKWGLCDVHGILILKPTYDDVREFSEGLAAVNLGALRRFPGMKFGGSWGYADEHGQLLIPCQFEFPSSFSEGLAQVDLNRQPQVIDRTGKVVLSGLSCDNFHDGLSPVHTDQETRFIDRTGKTHFTVDGYAKAFSEGLAPVSSTTEPRARQGKCGYVDKRGKFVIPFQFAEAEGFHEGLAAVAAELHTRRISGIPGKGDTWWGYIDGTGKFRIKPEFNAAHAFRDGIAKVHVGGKLQEVFDAPWYWTGGEWWLIDTKGKKLKSYRDRGP